MLYELRSQEFTTFTQSLRVAKDDYTARKVQKDRVKVKKLLDALLKDREVILYYKEDGQEISTIVTCKKFFEKEVWPDLPVVEPVIEIINNQEVPQIHHCLCWEFPSRVPKAIHVDSITKFIIYNKPDDNTFFSNLKHE